MVLTRDLWRIISAIAICNLPRDTLL